MVPEWMRELCDIINQEEDIQCKLCNTIFPANFPDNVINHLNQIHHLSEIKANNYLNEKFFIENNIYKCKICNDIIRSALGKKYPLDSHYIMCHGTHLFSEANKTTAGERILNYYKMKTVCQCALCDEPILSLEDSNSKTVDMLDKLRIHLEGCPKFYNTIDEIDRTIIRQQLRANEIEETDSDTTE